MNNKWRYGKDGGCKWQATTIFCGLFLSLLTVQAVMGSDLSSQLGQLEVRFFQHQYPKDSTEGRLSRLEKLIYGGVKAGAIDKRLNDLLTMMPATKLTSPEHTIGGSQSNKTSAETAGLSDGTSSYPAVTAIEKRLLGYEFSQEPLAQRLDRLEKKLFGKSSSSSDLQDRVEQLKQSTGVDIAKQVPAGSDWVEDDEMEYIPVRTSPLANASGENGKSSVGAITPFASPLRTLTQRPPILGMSQQVSALEKEIFGKIYMREALPARLNRLETTVFPGKTPSTGKPLPERVNHLLAVIPLSNLQPKTSRNAMDLDFDQDDFGTLTSVKTGGNSLSKIISSMSGFLNSGNSRTGRTMLTDPQTGLLVDPSTGSLIDPDTGVVVGQSARYGSNLNAYGQGTVGSFNSGFAPSGIMPYGFAGGNGVRFGFGGIGRYGMGVWP